MADRFAGKSAVITGGSTGIGLATAKRFVQEGMDHVFITGRRKDALDRAVAEIGKGVTAVQGDVASLSDLDRLYDEVRKRNRKIDVIFANAGIAQLAPFSTVDEKFYDLHFDANVKGVFFTVQKALPFINDGGSVILTGSIADVKGFPAISVYSATKAAIRSFARTWTNELKDRRIRVNTISPGHIDTPLFDTWQQGEALTKMKRTLAKNSIPGHDWEIRMRVAKCCFLPCIADRSQLCAPESNSTCDWRPSPQFNMEPKRHSASWVFPISWMQPFHRGEECAPKSGSERAGRRRPSRSASPTILPAGIAPDLPALRACFTGPEW